MNPATADSGESVVETPSFVEGAPTARPAPRAQSELSPLDRPSPEAFDRLARLACHLLRAPAAFISLVSGDSQVVRGWSALLSPGETRRQLPLRRSICEYVVRSSEPVVIEDQRALAAEEQPTVIPEFGGIAYAAVPLLARNGRPFGSLCVTDFEPRPWTADELAALRDLASSVASEIELAMAASEAEERALEAELARRERTALLEAAPQGIFGFDGQGRCTFVNRAASLLLGYAPSESIGRDLHDLVSHQPATGGPYGPGSCPLQNTFATATGVHLARELIRRRDDTVFMAEVSAEPVVVGGRVSGGVVTITDITERERSEERRTFLGDASDLLAGSLDYQTTLARVARLAIPTMADLCIVYILHSDRTITRHAVAAADTRKDELLRELCDLHPISLDSSGNAAARVMRTGRSELVPSVGEQQLREATDDEQVRELLRRLGLRSLLLVPLTARERTFGAIAFAMSESGRVFSERDLTFARELSGRCALAIDNAELYRDASGARRQAESANEAKSAFLAVMSHELRTPLSAILGYAELLADGITGPVSDQQEEQLGRIKTCAGQLLGLIDEILSFARLEADREEIRLDVVELGAMTRIAAALVEPRATEKSLEFVLALPARPLTIETDPGKVGQILVHLLSNAVKFTDRGWVRLQVEVEEGEILFEVSDSGIGIDPSHQLLIFEHFWQVEAPETRATTGAGLGLSVARRLSRLLGGEIEVRSAVGEGSIFTFHLPLPGVQPATY